MMRLREIGRNIELPKSQLEKLNGKYSKDENDFWNNAKVTHYSDGTKYVEFENGAYVKSKLREIKGMR